MSIEFPLERRQTPFGPISDPKIPVTVRTGAGDRTYRFLVDTGADFSVAPRRLAEHVGLAWATLPEVWVMGIEQGGVEARLGELPIRLAGVEMTVRCLFIDSPTATFILGRADFLERFVLTIDHGRQTIALVEIA